MSIPSYEKLGAFYLGREIDAATGADKPDLLLYDSRDLTTHAVCVGMTGSGKTGLCLSLLEEAAIDGIPAIAIDPKGDIGNLLLTFPQLRPEDFAPWVDPGEAARKGQSTEAYASATADTWRKGLADWGQDVPATTMDHANAGHDMSDMATPSEMDGMDGMDEMPGMMSSDEMTALAQASDVDFETMWLQMMIEHHQGAIEMATTEETNGAFPAALDLARSIIGSQQTEIDTMEELLGRG